MRFAFLMIATMYLGRRIGWRLSKHLLYSDHGLSLWLFLGLWGIAIGWIIRSALDAATPTMLVRWLFGYALGAYVAIPNYGLFIDSTIPPEDRFTHVAISWVPLLAYVATTVLLPVSWLPPLETLFVVGQWFVAAALGHWLASRHRRLWRGLGLALVIAFALNALISLADLALIGDALPGGQPSPPGWDPTRAQAVGEYAGTLVALIAGWVSGGHKRTAFVGPGLEAAQPS